MAVTEKSSADMLSWEFNFTVPDEGKTLMEDDLITRLTGRISSYKGEITRSLRRAEKEGNTIAKMHEKGSTQNFLLKGCVNTGLGHMELARKAQKNMEEAVALLSRMMVEVEARDPTLKEKCDQLVKKEENASEAYSDKISDVVLQTMQTSVR